MVASSALKLDTSMSNSIQSAVSQVTQYECVPKQDGNSGRRRLAPWGQSAECSMVNVYANMLQSQCLYMGTEMKQTATAREVCVSAGAASGNKMPESASRSLEEMITNMKECLNLNVTLLSSEELKVDLEPCFCAVVRFEESKGGRIRPVAVSVVDCYNSFSMESPMMRNLNAEAGNAARVFGLEMNDGTSAVHGLEMVVLWLYQYKNFPIRNDAPESPKENRFQEQAWLSNNEDPLRCSWKYLWELAIRSAQLES